MELSEFYVNQLVKQKSVWGYVTEVNAECVLVKWDDLPEPVLHSDKNDLASIKARIMLVTFKQKNDGKRI